MLARPSAGPFRFSRGRDGIMDMAGLLAWRLARESMLRRVYVVYRSSFVLLRPLSISPRGQATETLFIRSAWWRNGGRERDIHNSLTFE